MTEKTTYTMKDIARELGVRVATVSRALKDSPRISQEQRERIKAFAREHNFYPNAIAESLRQSKTRPSTLIGVIIPQINHYYFSSILAGIEEQANVRGYSVVVAQSGEQYEREVRICESFMHSRVCGVIVSQAKDTTKYEHFQELLDKHIPLVFYDRICTGMNTNRVVVDDYLGAVASALLSTVLPCNWRFRKTVTTAIGMPSCAMVCRWTIRCVISATAALMLRRLRLP